MSPKVPSARTIQAWRDSIRRSGKAQPSLRTLLGFFGAERRGSATMKRISEYLGSLAEDGAVAPLHLTYDPDQNLDESVSITSERIERYGPFFAGKEVEMEQQFGAAIASELDLEFVKAEHSPDGTRDRLDILCKDKSDQWVVVELKVRDGQRRAVEQLLRYMEHIRREKRSSTVRGVLVTGEGDLDTRRALETLSGTDLIEWFAYEWAPAPSPGTVKLHKQLFAGQKLGR